MPTAVTARVLVLASQLLGWQAMKVVLVSTVVQRYFVSALLVVAVVAVEEQQPTEDAVAVLELQD